MQATTNCCCGHLLKSDICVLFSFLAAQESWTDASAVRGGLQKKKVSFQLQYVSVVF